MAPSCFAELGKKASDIFTKGYHIGLFKVDLKTKTRTGVDFSTGGTSTDETGSIMGGLEIKYKLEDSNISFLERVTTDNKVFTEIMAGDCLMDGLKTAANVTFTPPTGEAKAQIKTAYTHEKFCFNADFDVNLDKPVLNTAIVVEHQGWFAGYGSAFDINDISITKHNFGLGFQQPDFLLHTAITDEQVFKGLLYQKHAPNIESGVQIAWKPDNADTQFGVGASYILDQDATLRAKIDNKCMVGVGYQQAIRPGVTMSLSVLFNGSKFTEGDHKVGFALEFQL